MKERPILFSAPMVRAILGGRKTQTRRVVKPQPIMSDRNPPYFSDTKRGDIFICPDRFPTSDQRGSVIVECESVGVYRCMGQKEFAERHSPYGQIGNHLWVRETWRIGAWDCDTGGIAIDYRADDMARREWISIPDDFDGKIFNRYWLQSCEDCETAGIETTEDGGWKWEPGQSPCRWRPSIHMPRWASRILLEVVSVRVERLQDISFVDAEAEGVERIGPGITYPFRDYQACPDDFKRCWYPKAQDSYRSLWEYINGAGSWAMNPWVWVVEFRRVTA